MGSSSGLSSQVSSLAIDPDLKKRIEVLLFVHDKPLSLSDFNNILDDKWKQDQIEFCLKQLTRELSLSDKPYSLEQLGGGWQLLTRSEYDDMIRKLIEVKKQDSLSKAQLESLAIIAYSQPITKFDIESIRGVSCAPVLKVLQEKDFIRIVGKAEKLGAPVLYGTTKNFLTTFGMNDISELPEREDIIKTFKEKLNQNQNKEDQEENAQEN